MPAYGGDGPFAVPRAATHGDISEAIEGFAASAAQAQAAGFDAVEVHGANGYLIDQFLTSYTNLRDDHYGGDPKRRTRFAAEVIHAVRKAVGPDFPVGIRLSQTKVDDLDYRWPGGATEAETIFRAVADAGADYLHLASEGRDWLDTATLDTGATVTALARDVTGLPVIANGGMHVPALAQSVLADNHADLVALGRDALANPDWPLRLAHDRQLTKFDNTMLKPDVTLDSQRAWEQARQHQPQITALRSRQPTPAAKVRVLSPCGPNMAQPELSVPVNEPEIAIQPMGIRRLPQAKRDDPRAHRPHLATPSTRRGQHTPRDLPDQANHSGQHCCRTTPKTDQVHRLHGRIARGSGGSD